MRSVPDSQRGVESKALYMTGTAAQTPDRVQCAVMQHCHGGSMYMCLASSSQKLPAFMSVFVSVGWHGREAQHKPHTWNALQTCRSTFTNSRHVSNTSIGRLIHGSTLPVGDLRAATSEACIFSPRSGSLTCGTTCTAYVPRIDGV